MIRILYRSADGQLRTDLTLAELPSAFADTKGLLWVDFEGEPPQVCQPLLIDIFGFHPLAVDDALVETHVPKVDDWGTYLYIALHAVHIDLKNGTPLEYARTRLLPRRALPGEPPRRAGGGGQPRVGPLPARPAARRLRTPIT